MFEELKGKRLLVLGSTAIISGIVKKAQNMGVYVFVVDNKPYELAPGKQIANEYADISFAEVERVVDYIKTNSIDGVITGYTDSYLPYLSQICEKAKLPCYGKLQQFNIATDKESFKKMCDDAGVPTIPGKTSSNFSVIADFAKQIGYPVMLKPVDNSGSRGVIKCECEKDLQNAFNYALSFSKIGKVICERYMDCENICVSYEIVDGEMTLSSMCDRYIYRASEGASSITSSLEYPSKYLQRYESNLNSLVIKMLKNNGFNNGMLSLQAFVDDKNFYMCEMCYRPSGGHHYILINDQNNVNELDLLLEYSLTGKVDKDVLIKENPHFTENCVMVHIIGEPGRKIFECKGFKELENLPNVIEVYEALFEGNEIGKDGTTAQVIGSVWFKGKSEQEIVDKIEEFKNTLSIKNENGDNLIRYIGIKGRL